MSEQVLRFLEQSSAVISLFAVLVILAGVAERLFDAISSKLGER